MPVRWGSETQARTRSSSVSESARVWSGGGGDAGAMASERSRRAVMSGAIHKRQALARKQPSGLASYYSYAAPLQTKEDGAPGYVDPETYQLPPEKEASSTENSSMWKVQAALSWAYGHRCWGSWGHTSDASTTSPGQGPSPSDESALGEHDLSRSGLHK